MEGDDDGESAGKSVSDDGKSVGELDGESVGATVIGCLVGNADGESIGAPVIEILTARANSKAAAGNAAAAATRIEQ